MTKDLEKLSLDGLIQTLNELGTDRWIKREDEYFSRTGLTSEEVERLPERRIVWREYVTEIEGGYNIVLRQETDGIKHKAVSLGGELRVWYLGDKSYGLEVLRGEESLRTLEDENGKIKRLYETVNGER